MRSVKSEFLEWPNFMFILFVLLFNLFSNGYNFGWCLSYLNCWLRLNVLLWFWLCISNTYHFILLLGFARFFAILQKFDEVIIVWFFFKFKLSAILHEFQELWWAPFAEFFQRCLLNFSGDVGVFFMFISTIKIILPR